MHLAKLARNFFVDRTPVSPSALVMKWDLITLERMFKFGQRASHEAQVCATQLLLQARVKEANEVAQDVTFIQKNLNAVETALKMATNYKWN